MKNITHTPVYADIRQGYVRHMLYTFQARSQTVAYAGIRRGRIFFKRVQTFCAYQAYALYDKHTLGTR
jgi:hypothetical protein